MAAQRGRLWHLPDVGCSKVRYANRYEAQAALEALQAKPTQSGQRVPNGLYGCQECASFHLTSHAKPGREWVPADERKKEQPDWITVRDVGDA